MLTTRTPQLSEGLVIWSHREAAFVPRTVPASGALLLDVPSTCLHIDSPEVREQVAYLGAAGRITLAETLTMAAKAAPKAVKKESRKTGEDEDEEEEGDGDMDGEGEGDEAEEGREPGVGDGAGDAPPPGTSDDAFRLLFTYKEDGVKVYLVERRPYGLSAPFLHLRFLTFDNCRGGGQRREAG